MRSLAICTVVLLSALIGGCATTTVEQRDYSSYFIGQTLSASVGESFLTDQGGSVRKYKHWVGILSSPDGWKVDEEYSPDYVRKELIYSGISGNVLDISYREYRGGLAAPAFFQTVKYDLSESKIIRFQRFQIEVLSANNQGIKCKLLSE